jgi:hypothetical protein
MRLWLNDGDAWDGSEFAGLTFLADANSDAPVHVVISMPSVEDFTFAHQVMLLSGRNTIHWDDLAQPDWVQEPLPFDPSDIETLWFWVDVGQDGPNPFELCISDLRILR